MCNYYNSLLAHIFVFLWLINALFYFLFAKLALSIVLIFLYTLHKTVKLWEATVVKKNCYITL